MLGQGEQPERSKSSENSEGLVQRCAVIFLPIVWLGRHCKPAQLPCDWLLLVHYLPLISTLVCTFRLFSLFPASEEILWRVSRDCFIYCLPVLAVHWINIASWNE